MRNDTDLSEILNEEIRAAASYFGIQAKVAGDLANAVTEKMQLRVGGASQYMRKRDIERRNREIYAAFTGNNLAALARQHDLSKRQVERIVVEQRRQESAQRGQDQSAHNVKVAGKRAR